LPVICEFAGVKICMYYHDHLPPHVHVLAPGFQALVSIPGGDVLAGKLPGKTKERVIGWVRENGRTLVENWHRTQKGEPIVKMRPPQEG